MTSQRHPLGYQTFDVMVDIDDVVLPWFHTVDQMCIDAWGPAPSGPCRSWSMHEHYGRTREEWEQIVIQATAMGLYTSTDPFPGAAEALRRIHWYGHRIHVVTARGFMANGENIRQWTRDYFTTFALPYETLTFAKDKPRAMERLDVRFDFAIDDGVHNFEALVEAGVPTWLHDAPHNLDYPAPPERRVSSLWEFSNLVLETTPLAEQKPLPA